MIQPAIPRGVVPGSPNHPAWLGVGSLALGTLALVTSEFLPASLLSRMGQDLDVSQGLAGQTVTATALMGAIVAPTISIVTRRLDRRFVIWGLTTLLVVSNGLVCATTNFWVTLLARLLLGIALAGFWSMAAATASRLVPPQTVAKAMSLILAGVSVATVCATPAGAFIGEIWGWRVAFALAGILGTVALIAQMAWLPKLPATAPASVSTLIHVSRRSRVRLGLIAVVFTAAGHFAGFTFVRPFLEQVPHMSAWLLSVSLLAFGLAGLAGNLVGGFGVDRSLRLTVAAAPLILGIATISLAFFGSGLLVSIAMVTIWGFAFGGVPIGLQTWMARAAPDHLESVGGLVYRDIPDCDRDRIDRRWFAD
jgi:predicted MFS family arabinose efflux permease